MASPFDNFAGTAFSALKQAANTSGPLPGAMGSLLPAGLPIVGALEGAINHMMARSEKSLDDCAKLSGSSFSVQFREFNYCITFLPNASGMQLLDRYNGEADVTVKGSVPAFVRMLIEQQQLQSMRGSVEVQGDVLLAQRYAELLGGLDLDWEDELAKIVGDVAAHQVGRFARGFLSFGKRAAQSFTQDSADYLREESKDLLHPAEMEDFVSGVEQLCDEVDHLQIRLQRLQSKVDAAN